MLLQLYAGQLVSQRQHDNTVQTDYSYLTALCPAPRSIDDLAGAATSSAAALPKILPYINDFDAFLIACYSPHPLVAELKKHTPKPVLGIFEASVSTALHLLGEDQIFGIVSTGEVWKQILGDAMREDLLGVEKMRRVFAGVETLGLNAGDLHGDEGGEEAKKAVMAATGRLIDADPTMETKVIVLGCAGMAGMEEWVREEAQRRDRKVRVVDGVKAGVGILQGLVRGQF